VHLRYELQRQPLSYPLGMQFVCLVLRSKYGLATCLYLQLLGIKASKKAINEMLADAGAGESGEVGYDAFVQIMTTQLLSPDLDQGSQRTPASTVKAQGPVLSFDTTVNEYRR